VSNFSLESREVKDASSEVDGPPWARKFGTARCYGSETVIVAESRKVAVVAFDESLSGRPRL
jgi:hypothetical protein